MIAIELTPKQKITLGMWGARLCGICLAAIPVGLFLMLFDNDPSSPNSNHALYAVALLVIILSLLQSSLTLWKSGKDEFPTSPRPRNLSPFVVSRIKTITIQSRITLAQYRKFTFRESYSSLDTIALHIVVVFLISFQVYRKIGSDWLNYLEGIYLLYLPYSLYRSSAERYKEDKMLNEKVAYQFTADGFTATGESFTTTMQWTAIEKITERKHWLLFHSANQPVIMIPKKAFKSFVAMATVRQMRNHLG